MIHSFFSVVLIFVLQFGITFQISNYKTSLNTLSSSMGLNELAKLEKPIISANDVLFVVKHNQSPNVVVYQANVSVQNDLDDKKPISVFWLMNSKGKATESLTAIEWKLAFGFKVTQMVKGKKYKMSLNAVKDKEIFIEKGIDGKVSCFMIINGQYSKLKDVSINFEHTLYIPNVKYIEFIGINRETGKLTAERVWGD